MAEQKQQDIFGVGFADPFALKRQENQLLQQQIAQGRANMPNQMGQAGFNVGQALAGILGGRKESAEVASARKAQEALEATVQEVGLEKATDVTSSDSSTRARFMSALTKKLIEQGEYAKAIETSGKIPEFEEQALQHSILKGEKEQADNERLLENNVHVMTVDGAGVPRLHGKFQMNQQGLAEAEEARQALGDNAVISTRKEAMQQLGKVPGTNKEVRKREFNKANEALFAPIGPSIDLMETLTENPTAVLKGSTTVESLANTIGSNVRGFIRKLGGAEDAAAYDEDEDSFMATLESEGLLASQADAQLGRLAYALARSLDPGGRLSDKDIEFARSIISGNGNPKVVAELMRDRLEEWDTKAQALELGNEDLWTETTKSGLSANKLWQEKRAAMHAALSTFEQAAANFDEGLFSDAGNTANTGAATPGRTGVSEEDEAELQGLGF